MPVFDIVAVLAVALLVEIECALANFLLAGSGSFKGQGYVGRFVFHSTDFSSGADVRLPSSPV